MARVVLYDGQDHHIGHKLNLPQTVVYIHLRRTASGIKRINLKFYENEVIITFCTGAQIDKASILSTFRIIFVYLHLWKFVDIIFQFFVCINTNNIHSPAISLNIPVQLLINAKSNQPITQQQPNAAISPGKSLIGIKNLFFKRDQANKAFQFQPLEWF